MLTFIPASIEKKCSILKFRYHNQIHTSESQAQEQDNKKNSAVKISKIKGAIIRLIRIGPLKSSLFT
jgi:hypothetical protein